jgi:HD superfamily phosphodiesterase
MAKTDWEQTRLWIALQKKIDSEAKSSQILLLKWMPKIETILTSGGTAATDFTLHDAGHSFRVAERMADIIPKEVLSKLSSFDLTLLLFSSYLHDIGMTPDQKRVKQHFNYLLSGEKGGLSHGDRR